MTKEKTCEELAMQILRKECSRVIYADNTEVVVNDYKKIHLLSYKELDELSDQWEDPEEAYMVGIYLDMDYEIQCINIDNLLEGLNEYFDNCDDEDKENSYRYEIFTNIKDKLKKYAGYTLWL